MFYRIRIGVLLAIDLKAYNYTTCSDLVFTYLFAFGCRDDMSTEEQSGQEINKTLCITLNIVEDNLKRLETTGNH